MAATNRTTPNTTPTTASTLLAARDVKDFTFGPGLTDVRGWDVMGPGSTKLGTVDRIMLDKQDKKPRYLSVLLPDKRGHLLLPVGVGHANSATRQVSIDALTPDVLKSLPTLTQELVTVDHERQVVGAVAGPEASRGAPAQWYALPAFDPARLFGAPRKPAS